MGKGFIGKIRKYNSHIFKKSKTIGLLNMFDAVVRALYLLLLFEIFMLWYINFPGN